MNSVKALKILILISVFMYTNWTLAQENQGLHLSADVYASYDHIMQYRGQVNDVAATLYVQHNDFFIKPFIRASASQYNFSSGVAFTDYSRSSLGIGLDLIINKYLRLRLLDEQVYNGLTGTSYNQDSYGIIYNQYIAFEYIEFNNYLESFLIPRISSNKMDTYVRVQALKSFYLLADLNYSHVVYPFAQLKAKFNDDQNFGLSGNSVSTGIGYKYFKKINDKNTLAFLLEGHSLVYQSRDFNGDWMQIFAAIQYRYE